MKHTPDLALGGIAQAIRDESRSTRAGIRVSFTSKEQTLLVQPRMMESGKPRNRFGAFNPRSVLQFHAVKNGYNYNLSLQIPCRSLDINDPELLDRVLGLVRHLAALSKYPAGDDPNDRSTT